MKTIEVYTDGSCLGNGKDNAIGGYGIFIKGESKRTIICRKMYNVTNNQMELLAVIRALEILEPGYNILLYTDSSYVVNAINKNWITGWKKNNWSRSTGALKNSEFWKTLYKLITEKHSVEFIWVKGHADNLYNNICDRFARKSAESKDDKYAIEKRFELNNEEFCKLIRCLNLDNDIKE